MKQILFKLIPAIAPLLVAACTGAPATPTGAETAGEAPTAQPMPGALVAVPGSNQNIPGLAISMLSQAPEEIAWQTDGSEPRSLSIQEIEGAYPEIFDPGLSKIGSVDVSPSGRVIAFIVGPVVGSLTLNGWHLGLADMDGSLVGLYSAQTEPRCWIVDFVWRPDEKGIVVELPGCGLVLLTEDAKVVFDVPVGGFTRNLYVSPDSRWAALDDGPGDQLNPRVDRRIKFISLEDPNIRLDLPAAGIIEWLNRKWVKRPRSLGNS